MARTRTTKKLAQRIDLNYFKRPTPLKRAKFWLSVSLPALALAWIAWRGFSGDHRVYSDGRLSEPHAILEKECALCHDRARGVFSAKANMFGCLSCHDGPMHHSPDYAKNDCVSCHSEHRGRVNISATSNQACAECHADLQTSKGATDYAKHIHSFEDGHPEFAALRPSAGRPASDSGTIKLNHKIHMKPIPLGPHGPMVQLDCGDCHRPGAASGLWTYADAHYTAASASYSMQSEVLPLATETLRLPKPMTGRELMAPVRFAYACAGCHSLAFDKRFDEGAPHDQPEVVHAFLVKKFQQYIAAHANEIRVIRDAGRPLTGKPLAPAVRVLTPGQWVAERTAEAEDLLWRKTCQQCHTLYLTPPSRSLKIPQTTLPTGDKLDRGAGSVVWPYVAEARIHLQWMPHAKFDHDAHRGFACLGCHERALTSTEGSDILLPGIKTCQKCHAAGPDHAESRCFECHVYHDWSKRKEITPRFTLPALRIGGR